MQKVTMLTKNYVYLLIIITSQCSKSSALLDNITDMFGMNSNGIWGVLVGSTTEIKPTQSVDAESLKLMLRRLLLEYDVRIRPRRNQSDVIDVHVSFILNSVVTLDTTEQRIDVLGIFSVQWEDELLYWDPIFNNDVTGIKLPLTQIWRPKLVILKAIKGSNFLETSDHLADVFSTNSTQHVTVSWVPENIYSVLCDVDVTYYPFDVQECRLEIYVSDEDISSVFLHGSNRVILDHFTENAEWKLLSVTTAEREQFGTNIVSITFRLERRAEFTLYTVVLPLLLLSTLVAIGVLTPVDSGEKIGYKVTLFLTFCFSVFTLRDGLPHNSLGVSYFLVYLMELLLVSVVSVLYSIVQIRIYTIHGDKPFKLFGSNALQTRTKVSPIPPKRHPTAVPIKMDIEEDHPSASCIPEDITWAEALTKLDQVVFKVLTVLIALFTIIFFASVSNRS